MQTWRSDNIYVSSNDLYLHLGCEFFLKSLLNLYTFYLYIFVQICFIYCLLKTEISTVHAYVLYTHSSALVPFYLIFCVITACSSSILSDISDSLGGMSHPILLQFCSEIDLNCDSISLGFFWMVVCFYVIEGRSK